MEKIIILEKINFLEKKLPPPYLRAHVIDRPVTGTSRYKNSFFLIVLTNGIRFSQDLRNCHNVQHFKNLFSKTIKPAKNPTFGILHRSALSKLSRLRVDFSDLRRHRFDHNFNCSTRVCSCGHEDETTEHVISIQRNSLYNSLPEVIRREILEMPNDERIRVLLFGNKMYNEIINKLILEATNEFIKSSHRFDVIEAYQT